MIPAEAAADAVVRLMYELSSGESEMAMRRPLTGTRPDGVLLLVFSFQCFLGELGRLY